MSHDEQAVVVIGASVAGLFAAHKLARCGIPVRVYERARHRTPMARTLIVTPEMERVLGFSAASATRNKVHTLELWANARSLPISLREPDLIIERAELLRLLERRAAEAGAELVYGYDFVAFETIGGATRVVLRERETGRTQRVAARAVLASDGVRSHVARSVRGSRQPAVSVLQARVSRPAGTDPSIGKVWFRPRDTPYFYWLSPESERSAAVGLVDANPRHARRKLDGFLAEQGLEPLDYQSALVPLYRPGKPPMRRVGDLDVLFLGDAAGQVKVTTIGGTVSGLLGADAAARSIAHGTSYLRELRGVERELRLHWHIRAMMNRFREHEYDVLLQLLHGRVGRLLEIHNRDRLARVFLSMLAVQPRLPLLAAKVLWRVSLQA